jgi:hypothetical protein
MSTYQAEHKRLKTAVQSGLLMTFQQNTYSELMIRLSIDFSSKTEKFIVKNKFDQFQTVCKGHHSRGNDKKKAKIIG